MAKPRPLPSHPPFTLRSPTVHPPFTQRSPGGSRHPITKRSPGPSRHPPFVRTFRRLAEPFGWICNPAEVNISICNAPPRVCNIVYLCVFRHCKCLYSLWSDCKSGQTAANPAKRRQIRPNGSGLPYVGAGPVPARTPDRAFICQKLAVQIAPDGAAGWHGACPYTRRGLPAKRRKIRPNR